MDQTISKHKSPRRRAIIGRILLQGVAIAVLAVLFIVFRRGYMNYTNRMDFIAQRLDDYPRLLENFIRETEELQALWLTTDYQKRAEQAAFLYRWNETGAAEAEKLAHIAGMIDAERVRVIAAAEREAVAKDIEARGFDAAFAPLTDDRLVALEIARNDKFTELRAVEYEYFLSQLEAGMPGYMLLLREGAPSIYPRDEGSEAVLRMVRAMFDSGALSAETIKGEAAQSPNGIAFSDTLSAGTADLPEGSYILRCAGYADSDDIVISAAGSDSLRRYGRKRTWSLAVLTLSVFFFMSLALWRTKLYIHGEPPKQGRWIAFRRCGVVFMLASVVLLVCVLDVQMISTVNQSQESTSATADFLRSTLTQEQVRADIIAAEFERIYQKRAEVAARALSDDPKLIDLDALRELDEALGGIGLRVYDATGAMIASDDLYHVSAPGGDDEPEQRALIFRAPLTGANGRTTGFLSLHADSAKLDAMLADTRTDEVLSDLHILDTLRVLAVDKADRHIIVAGSQPNWVGDSVEERGIPSTILFDGYEGVVVLEGDQMYCMVFTYGNSLILVASRDVSPIVFLEGIALLALGLLLLLAALYLLMIRGMYDLQAADARAGAVEKAEETMFPPVKAFMRNFMLSVFGLSVALFLITNGNTSSLTYNMVRGVWVRGINVVTVTSCLMAISGIVTFYTLLTIVLSHMSKYLRPKGKTICHLIDSGSHYVGAIFLTLYALSLFGVDTATLLGGAGVIALVFTLGANSLISDVLAGFFIIFEGDIMVGDVVEIGGFRGIVTDITMRTTKLMDDNTQDIKVINNSQIGDLINQSRKVSCIMIDIRISHDVGLVRGEQIVREALAMLPGRCPEIIGKPQYLGVMGLPERNDTTGKISSTVVRVSFECFEKDRENLTYKLHRELVWVAHMLLNDDSPIGIEGCKVE